MMLRFWLLIFMAYSLFSCKSEEIKELKGPVQIAEASIDDDLADSLKIFFTSNYFLKDSAFLIPDSSAFQFYKIDLNEDGEKETFIRFMDSYFCGSGGCTFLILNQQMEVLNRFTAMNAPVIVSHEIKNRWNVILNHSEGKLREITSKNNRYPSNPTMVPNSSIMIHKDDVRMFDDEINPSKTYYF